MDDLHDHLLQNLGEERLLDLRKQYRDRGLDIG